jgi:hypothetical protein
MLTKVHLVDVGVHHFFAELVVVAEEVPDESLVQSVFVV